MIRSRMHQAGSDIRLLHLLTLAGFAVAQPLYDLLGRNPDFFIARHAHAGEIGSFILTVSILIPLLLFGLVTAAAPLGRAARNAVHGLVLLVLVALICLPLLNRTPLPALPAFAVAVLAGCLGAYAYFSRAAVRRFVSLLSPAIVIFPLVFVLASPIRAFILPTENERTDDMAARTQDRPLPTVVMVLLDELPVTSLLDENGTIDARLFPNFAAMADDAYLFRNTITVSDNTLTAIPAVLTGNYPEAGLTASTVDHPQNLFTLLEGRYEFNVVESVTALCPERLCPDDGSGYRWLSRYENLLSDLSAVYLHLVTPGQYRDRLPSISSEWKDFRWREARVLDNSMLHERAVNEVKADRADAFARFVDAIEPHDGPVLHFLHILLPHAPYIHLPSGRVYALPTRLERIRDGRWEDDEPAVLEAYHRHLLQLAFVDTQIGALVTRLKKLDLYDSSLLVLAADHGVSFHPGTARRSLTGDNYEDIAPVPLIIKRPGQADGMISDRRAETIDILPSILDVLDIRPRQQPHGRSLFAPDSRNGEPRKVYYDHAANTLVIDESELRARRSAALRRKHALLGEPDSGLYEFGPVELPARPLREFSRLDTEPLIAELDHAFLFDDIDPSGPFMPSYISGRIHTAGGLKAADRIGIAVNDVLWAITEPRDTGDSTARFSVIVPERAFAAGANRVQAFLARPRDNGEVALVPVDRAAPASTDTAGGYRLSGSGNEGGELFTPDGTSARIEAGALEGWLDGVYMNSGLVQFTGWAADLERSEPARRVVMFKNGEFLHAADAADERIDVLQYFNEEDLKYSGFNITLPATQFEDDSDVVRIFALSEDGRASELHYPDDFRWKHGS